MGSRMIHMWAYFIPNSDQYAYGGVILAVFALISCLLYTFLIELEPNTASNHPISHAIALRGVSALTKNGTPRTCLWELS